MVAAGDSDRRAARADLAPPPAAEIVAPPPPAEALVAPSAPRIISATKPPARGLMLGTERRDYPLLRGAIVKLAHDNAALAGRVLTALLPAQGAVIDGPLGYDLTISGVGTYSIAIAGGRASSSRSTARAAAPTPSSTSPPTR